MSEEKYVHGYHVMFEESAAEGMRYLDDRLDSECAKVFFVYAQRYGKAPFEDQQGRKYMLSYENEMYVLNKK
ncbi:MAG TPA: hypothetical protein P5323_00120 [Candidatus Moranbacteria bacterium]|nr:hypothetical protein [Candidatus Moranbacteria bacterium]HRY27530.1 hypothetical protein [Candidatus Moranbacteria bacterium]HSA07759.1 hypothetical protein [Candidatus Moranbacteria bacterium]